MLWWSLHQLKSKRRDARSDAVRALSKSKSQRAVKAIIVALRDPDSWVREAAASALGRMKDPLGVEPLIDCLVSGAIYKTYVIESLGALGDDGAVKPLIDAFNKKYKHIDWQDEDRIIDALAAIGTDEALQFVWDHAWLTESLVDRLLQTGPEAKARLIERMSSRLGQGRLPKPMADKLVSLGWQPSSDAEQMRLAIINGEYEKAAGYGIDAVEPLVEALKKMMNDKALPAQMECIVVLLGKLADGRAAYQLTELLKRQNLEWRLHKEIIQALANIGDTKNLPAVLSSLWFCEASVRRGFSGVPGDSYCDNKALWAASLEIIKKWGISCFEPILQRAINKNEPDRVASEFLKVIADQTTLQRLIPLVASPTAPVAELAVDLIDTMVDRDAARISVEDWRSLAALENPTALVQMDVVKRCEKIRETASVHLSSRGNT